jgi:hypothetical protein
MGSPLPLLALVPGLADLVNLALLAILAILAVSIAASPSKQGLHDRFAGSAIVQPAGQGNAAAIGCIVLLVVAALLLILPIVALIFLGGQVEEILSELGTSI